MTWPCYLLKLNWIALDEWCRLVREHLLQETVGRVRGIPRQPGHEDQIKSIRICIFQLKTVCMAQHDVNYILRGYTGSVDAKIWGVLPSEWATGIGSYPCWRQGPICIPIPGVNDLHFRICKKGFCVEALDLQINQSINQSNHVYCDTDNPKPTYIESYS